MSSFSLASLPGLSTTNALGRSPHFSSGTPMDAERLLELYGGDVLPAGYHNVLGSVHELHVAVGVHAPQVAGVKPAVPERLGRRLLVVEIALHDVVAAHHDLAHRHAVSRHVIRLLVDDAKPLRLDHPDPLAGEERRACVHVDVLPA